MDSKSFSRIPKGLEKLKATVAKFAKDPLYAKFCNTLFDLPTHGAREQAAIAFLVQFLTKITVLDSNHTVFYQAFKKFRERLHQKGDAIRPTDAKEAAAHIVCYVGSNYVERGFWTYSTDITVMWLFELHLAEDSPIRNLTSISNLPNTYLTCFFEADPHLRSILAPMRRSMLRRLLHATSPDQSEWWMRSQVLAPNLELLLFSSDQEIIRLYEESISSTVLDSRSKTLRRVVDNRGRTYTINLNSHQVVATAYLHTAYRLSRWEKPEHLERIAEKLGAGQELLFRLFPLVMDMINGATLWPDQLSLLDLYEADDGGLFRELAQIAEDIRQALLLPQLDRSSKRPVPRSDVSPESLSQVLDCYVRTEDLYRAMTLYVDTRHRILVDKQLIRSTRWTYSCTKELAFCEFFHSLRHDLQNFEAIRLSAWLDRPGVKSRFEVNRPNITLAADLLESLNKPDGDCQENVATEARKLMSHLLACNRTFSVLRFPESVRYHEVSMTLAYLCNSYPERMRATRSEHWPDENSSEMWESDSFFLGVDPSGPYLVAFREDLEILRQMQLMVALQSTRFHKTMPVFPVLVRFYFGNYASMQSLSASVSFLQQPKPEVSVDQSPSARAKNASECDRHAVHVVAQTLAFWLRLPTEQSLLCNKSSDVTPSLLRTSPEHSKRPLEPPTAAAASSSIQPATFIPKFGENFFPCLRFMHRFADQLSRAASSSSPRFPSTADYNALADFLELRRPRIIRRSLLEQMLSELERAHSRLPGDAASTVELLQAFLARPVAQPPEEPPTAIKRQRLEEPPKPMIFLQAATLNNPNSLLGRMMQSLGMVDELTMCNWLVIYAPVINNRLSPQLVNALLRAPESRVQINGRRPISEDTFRDRLYLGAYDAPISAISDFLANYASCFVTPASVSWYRLDQIFVEEPMQAFVDLMRSLEQLVSTERLGAVMAEHMNSDSFDVDTLFDESFCNAELPQKEPMRSVARDVIHLDGRSMLPVQAYGATTGMPIEFAFYENSFCLIMVSGQEFARFVGTSRAFDELRDENDYAPTRASRAEKGFGRLLDVALRFAPKLDVLAYSHETKWRSWNSFMEKRKILGAKEPGDKIDRTKLFREFSSSTDMFEFARKVWEENRSKEASEQAAATAAAAANSNTPGLRALVELLRKYEIYKKIKLAPITAGQQPFPWYRKQPPIVMARDRPYADLYCFSGGFDDILEGLDQNGSFMNPSKPNLFAASASFVANMQLADAKIGASVSGAPS